MADTETLDKQKQDTENKAKVPPTDQHEHVRPAGPEGAGVDPEKWDIVDEEVDESFPASDAPSNY